jgi:hypothetical protein
LLILLSFFKDEVVPVYLFIFETLLEGSWLINYIFCICAYFLVEQDSALFHEGFCAKRARIKEEEDRLLGDTAADLPQELLLSLAPLVQEVAQFNVQLSKGVAQVVKVDHHVAHVGLEAGLESNHLAGEAVTEELREHGSHFCRRTAVHGHLKEVCQVHPGLRRGQVVLLHEVQNATGHLIDLVSRLYLD